MGRYSPGKCRRCDCREMDKDGMLQRRVTRRQRGVAYKTVNESTAGWSGPGLRLNNVEARASMEALGIHERVQFCFYSFTSTLRVFFSSLFHTLCVDFFFLLILSRALSC